MLSKPLSGEQVSTRVCDLGRETDLSMHFWFAFLDGVAEKSNEPHITALTLAQKYGVPIGKAGEIAAAWRRSK